MTQMFTSQHETDLLASATISHSSTGLHRYSCFVYPKEQPVFRPENQKKSAVFDGIPVKNTLIFVVAHMV